ncbi:MAG: multidrug efflux SMR transporter [Thermoguttaceae bacterium]|jgi:small multidrug resistance pump
MCWFYLVLAILTETVGTTFMKLSTLSEGLTRLGYGVLMLALYALSLGLVALAIKRIEVSVAYAIWSGMGTAIIALIGIVGFQEQVTTLKVVSLVLIILGVAGLS